MKEKEQVKVIVKGRVQGVFFRMECRNAALKAGVTGYVKNLPDKSVEAVFQGTPAQINRMLDWCRQGPPHGRVDDLITTQMTVDRSFEEFDIRY